MRIDRKSCALLVVRSEAPHHCTRLHRVEAPNLAVLSAREEELRRQRIPRNLLNARAEFPRPQSGGAAHVKDRQLTGHCSRNQHRCLSGMPPHSLHLVVAVGERGGARARVEVP
eukprot:Mycagemm_TRINITY_DN8827_c0_g2::TRINITY_DN8827_c0_g2_i1::g.1891::m.1891 type:complete len:114 gc:universal TRINITY_DN8827_c0_g2_i1:121-462(+)